MTTRGSYRPLTSARSGGGRDATWDLRHAKARLSEVIRRTASDGPQHITVHGQERAVVLSIEAYQALIDTETGAELFAVLAACPDPDLQLPEPVYSPVRDPEPLP